MIPSLLRPALLPLLLGATFHAQAIPLAPQLAGTYLNGDGANSRWVQIADDWRGSIYGDQTWGTGIWGLADHAQVMGLSHDDPAVVQTLQTRVDQINFGDQHFIDAWGAAWSSPQLAPIFTDPTTPNTQDNWASSFWGYIAISTPGAYNFGVLHDDGFRFSLFGAGGSSLSLVADGLNSRDRLGFAEDLLLSPGLYAYQLDAYDRLEAGVIQLAWTTPDSGEWTVVAQSHLFTSPVPEPSMPLLMLAGVAAVGLATARARR